MAIGALAALAIDVASAGRSGITTVGALPASLPPVSMPNLSVAAIRETAAIALAITILALTEAVSIARSIAVRSGQRIDNTQEFIGQGLSNVAGAFFSSYASSGSFNRSGVNYDAGARTPLAAASSALFLLAILFAVAPLAAYLPHAAMAAVLVIVAWGLIDFKGIRQILRTSRNEAAVLVLTFLSGVFYSVGSLPSFWQAASHLNPFFYMIDGFRRGFFGVSDTSPWVSLAIVSGSLLAVSALALHLLRSGYKLRS
jgi:SulP family sulfate permease